MKKIIALLMLAVLLLSSLTACSQSARQALDEGKQPVEQKAEQQKEATTAAKDSAAKADSTSPKEKTKIEFWFGLGSRAGETMNQMIQDFNASQDEVEVVGVQQASYDDTFQKLQAAIAAKKVPGVVLSDHMQQLARLGVLEPLDQHLTEQTPLKDYLDVFVQAAQINGALQGIPAYGTTQVIYYRKDILEKAKIDPKEMYKTWENVYKYSKELQEKGLVKYGHLPMWGADNMIDFARSNGGEVLSADGKTVTINSPEWVQAWDFIRKQVFENKTAIIESGGQGWEYWYRTIDDVMNGTAVSYTGSSGDKGDLDFKIIDSTIQPGFAGHEPKAQANALYLVIPKLADDAQKRAAMAWIAYFTSPENSARWSEKIGYIPVRKSSMEVPAYKKFIADHPYAGVPYQQALIALPAFDDLTNGKIYDALKIAVDKVLLENVPAKEALDAAQKAAQEALDEIQK